MHLKPDIEIAREATLLPITEVAARAGLEPGDIEQYGCHKAKIAGHVLPRLENRPDGRLILVTAITATPAGEGKTVTSIGLAQALNHIGHECSLCLREPSLGPLFGIKGGATGGGYAQVVPMEDINLHFTGDFNAISSANNLLSALVDNHIFHGNALEIDPASVTWPRAMDICDRSLRRITTCVDLKDAAEMRARVVITAASEIMAIVSLARDIPSLKEMLGRIIVGANRSGQPVRAHQLGAVGAMAVLLRDALRPNLVQTLENTPAFVHCGPFANIAHGCNSVQATRLALKLSDWVVTEAGFAADLGAEKFFDIKCPVAGLKPAVAVVVASCRALKMHGGVAAADIAGENVEAMLAGCENLRVHVENVGKFGVPAVVAINRFPTDTDAEIAALLEYCVGRGFAVAVSEVAARGGQGGADLARLVVQTVATQPADFHPLYPPELSVCEKIEKIAREIYRADGVDYSPDALQHIGRVESWGMGHLPICMAKTQLSISDRKELRGAPTGWRLQVNAVYGAQGAGFLVVLTGTMMLMPGLPSQPASGRIDLLDDGRIVGLS